MSAEPDTVRVAVIDSGIEHVDDLRAEVVQGTRCAPECGQPTITDSTGHGTKVAALIDAVAASALDPTGAARIELVPVQVGAARGELTTEAIANAIDWVASERIPIANLSATLGGFEPDVSRAIAEAEGTLFSVPAGNEGLDLDRHDSVGYPCRDELRNLICVAAAGDGETVSLGSNWGRVSVDLLAPGENVVTLDARGRRVHVSGTSFAAPLVSGAAALLLLQHPGATADEVADALLCGARTSREIATSVAGGYLDIAGALRCASG